MVVTQLDIFQAIAAEEASHAEIQGFTVSDAYTPEVLLEALEQWQVVHGLLGSFVRSHMWHDGYSNGHEGAHPWVRMTADLRPDLWKDEPPGLGPGALVDRVYCFDCQWWTPIRDSRHHSPTIDYLDHCWPGWRYLPPIPFKKKNRMGAPHPSEIPDDYPNDWKTPGAPSINWANPNHTPPISSKLYGVGRYSPFGGMGVTIHPNFDYPTLARVTKEAA